MSENDLGKPEPDTIEQRQSVIGDQERPPSETLTSLPLDANDADAVEQHREVPLDEDDYR